MKILSAALKAHLAGEHQTIKTCWLTVLVNGTVIGFTDHDADITFNLETWFTGQGLTAPVGVFATGNVTYTAATGYTATDVASSAALNVDNMDVDGMLTSPAITEADLKAGLWDFASIHVFMVNWADLTMGALVQRSGNLGEVTLSRDTFKAELRGLTQAYSRTLGELTQPGCRAELYDTRCKVNPAAFTVTGTITGVNPDGVTLYDPARTEAGPTGGIAITGISNSNPGHVTVASGTTLSNGMAITISGVVGPTLLNLTTIVRNLSGNIFDLGVDTTNVSVYPAYVSGGTVTPLGGTSGYFDYGKITFTSGLNNGLSMEVSSYTPGQWQLELPMPYTVAIGDAYTMRAGCNKSLATCKGKFNNVVNMRAEPYLPGIDQIVQVGKQ